VHVRKKTLAALLVTAGVALQPGAPAQAAGDTTPPTLNTPAEVGFVVGSQLDAYSGDYSQVKQLVTWSGSDAGSGICSYDLDRTAADSGEDRNLVSGTQATSFVATANDYDGAEGGGSTVMTGYRLRGHDCAGNTSTRTFGSRPSVFQEDGTSHDYTLEPALTYAGAWTGSSCTCFSGGKARYTTQKGASATFTADFAPGSHVAVVMVRKADRGAVEVRVDGRKATTVNLDRGGAGNRIVAFDRKVGGGSHSVTIVDLRGKVDLDAVLVS